MTITELSVNEPITLVPTPTSPADGGEWAVRDRYMMRVSGLPIESVHALRCRRSTAWADAVAQRQQTLSGVAEVLADELYSLINDNTDVGLRRSLLALRRAVFNRALPKDTAGALAAVAGTDHEIALRLADYLDLHHQHAQAVDTGAQIIAEELADSRTALRTLAGEDRLLSGLLLASPSLVGQLGGYVDAVGQPDKRARKIERSLLSYLYRTACKTSPFSTFTAVAVGTLAGEPVDAPLPERWTSHVRLNVVALARLSDLILADPARRDDLPIAAAPGWGREDGRVRYVRRTVSSGDTAAAVTFDAASDRLFFLRRSGVLEAVLARFEQVPEQRYGELVAWLETELRAPAADCRRYLSDLLVLGMIGVPTLTVDVHTVDPVRTFQTSLRLLDRPWAEELAARLQGPIDCIDRYPAADTGERRVLLARLRQELTDAAASLVDSAVGGDVEGEKAASAAVPSTVLYEDVLAGTDPVAVDLRKWTEVAADSLRDLESVLPAFDLSVAGRINFAGFFLARFGRGGRCDDLLQLVHDFHEDFYDQYQSFAARRQAFDASGEYQPEDNWMRLSGLTALDSARTAFVAGVADALSAADREDGTAATELTLSPDLVRRVADLLPDVRAQADLRSHFVQLADDPVDPLVVLNRSYGGLYFPFSRFSHGVDRALAAPGSDTAFSADLLADAVEVQPPGAVFAEITGGAVTTNLNLHARMTEYEIVCPGETSSAPGPAQIRVDDLYLVHDPAADRLVLRSTRLDREVIPVYLGYLVPMALPEIPRTLLLLSSTSMAPVDVFGGVPRSAPVDGVTSRPRVRYGNVVLHRRSWSVPVEVIPRRRPAEADHEWFLRWTTWRRRHDLPDQVFATVYGTGDDARANMVAKPQYLDFCSVLSLIAFEGLIRTDDGTVVLREMLPAESGLHIRSGRGHHVAELAVETLLRRPPVADLYQEAV